MAGDSRVNTTLGIKVDGRQLNDLEKQTKRVFSRKTPEEFNRVLGTIQRSLQDNVREHERVVTAMSKVKRGTSAYKDLAKELKIATREARDLQKALSSVSATGAGGGGSGGGGGGGGSGKAKQAGARIQGNQRGVPNVQAPMPGMGAITTSLAAIPVAGAVAAGSLMAAAGTYQSALRYQQARLQATPFLMGSRAAVGFAGLSSTTTTSRRAPTGGPAGGGTPAGGMGSTGLTEMQLAADTHTRGLGAGLAKITSTAENVGGFFGGRIGRRIAGAQARAAGSFYTGAAELSGASTYMRNRREKQIIREQSQARATQAHLEEYFGGPTAGQPGITDTSGGLSGAAKTGLKQAASGVTRTTTVTDRPFDEKAIRSAGLRMGYAPAQAMQMASQMSQAAGRPVGARQFEQGLGLQRTLGIGVQQSGSAMQALRRGGQSRSNRGDMREVGELIGVAMVTGLKGSEIGQELQKQTGFLSAQSNKGIRVDVGSMNALQLGLGTGKGALRGFRAGEVARQFTGGVSDVGYKGVQGPVQQRLLEAQFRVMGKGGGKTNIEDYSEALFRMQSGTDIAELLPEFLKSFELGDKKDKPFFQARIFQQALGAIGGARLGPEEALDLSNRFMSIDPNGKASFDLEGATTAAGELVNAQGGLVKAEAGLEGRRVGIGGQIAPAMLKLQGVTLNMAATFNNLLGGPLKQVAGITEKWTEAMVKSTEEMDNWLADRGKN